MTLDQVKKKFEREGKTFKQFADETGLNYRTVIGVVNGVNKGRFGEAHRVAVALGLKSPDEAPSR
jgi:gp16 family phage-associated protein